MATKKNDKYLSKAVLLGGGLQGMKLTYESLDIRGNREYRDVYPGVEKKAPVPKVIVEKFQELSRYLLDICGYVGTDDEMEYLESRLSVTGFNYTNKGFVISGSLKVLDECKKAVALSTPLITDGNEYDKFVDVCRILDDLYIDVKEYEIGKQTLSDMELLMSTVVQQKLDFDKEKLDGMSEEEKTDYATRYLEGMGAIVLTQKDTKKSKKEDELVPTESVAIPTKVAKISKVSMEVTETNFGDEEDFNLDIKLND